VILPTEKLIFIHIPKTGGASVEDFIIDKLGYERNSLFMTNNLGLLKAHNGLGLTLFPHMHYPLKDVVKIANSSKIKVDNSWTIFSIVRNPYYKLISELFFTDLIPLKYHYHSLPENVKDKFFNECLDEYFSNSNYSSNRHSNHSLPQYKFFEGTDLNYKIFKFEEGLENIMIKLGFEVNDDFPHVLNTFELQQIKKPNYRDVLTPYLVEVVNEKYAKDFEIFGYEMLSPLDI